MSKKGILMTNVRRTGVRVVIATVLAVMAGLGGVAFAGSASADPMKHQSAPATSR
ncbi:hypothetical protein AB0G06_12755 [Nonomuraea dietziae]|uniref:hypothetical protein n=1 Tax=Nonomuraea dietziae TaxID=65515 RepID=UPI00340C9798